MREGGEEGEQRRGEEESESLGILRWHDAAATLYLEQH